MLTVMRSPLQGFELRTEAQIAQRLPDSEYVARMYSDGLVEHSGSDPDGRTIVLEQLQTVDELLEVVSKPKLAS